MWGYYGGYYRGLDQSSLAFPGLLFRVSGSECTDACPSSLPWRNISKQEVELAKGEAKRPKVIIRNSTDAQKKSPQSFKKSPAHLCLCRACVHESTVGTELPEKCTPNLYAKPCSLCL